MSELNNLSSRRHAHSCFTRLWCLFLCLIMLAVSVRILPVTTAEAATSWPSLSSSRYAKTYTLSDSKKYQIYDKKHKPVKNRYISSSDRIYITGIKGSWATIKYPSGKKRKTGYVPLKTFTTVSTPKNSRTAKSSATVYRRSKGSKTTTKISKGSTLYTLTTSNNRTQILFSVKSSGKISGWRMGWVSTSSYKKLTTNPTGSTLKISGVNKPSKLTLGATFNVTGTVTSNYKIKEVRVSILNANSKVVSSHTAYPHSKSYNLAALDDYILFNHAKKGTNYYIIWAKDEKTTTQLKIPYTVVSASSSASSGKSSGGSSNFLGYASYKGVDYKKQTSDRRRIAALNKARKMATVKWRCGLTFPTWYNSDRTYSYAKATDGTVSNRFLKGKTYVGIPYSMYNHSYDDNAWANFIKSDYSYSQIAAPYYSYTYLTTSKGTDCSYFVYLCMLAGGANVTYQTTYMMYNGRYYKKISKSSLKPGDILLTKEHVRLYAGMVGGKYAVFESTGDGSKTRYKLFTKSQLSSYSAYRYKYW